MLHDDEYFHWDAEWIGAARPPADPAPARLPRLIFRRSFFADCEGDALSVRVSASARYALLLNGVEISRGPQRSQPWRLRHDVVDASAHVRAGRNVFAVVVTADAGPTAVSQRAVPSGRLGIEPALLFEADLAGRRILGDETWRVLDTGAWTTFGRGRLDGLPTERTDARALPVGWMSADFDDSGWDLARPVGAGHRGATGRARPPVAPFGLVPPRTVAAPGRERLTPRTTTAWRVAGSTREQRERHPAETVAAALTERVVADEAMPDGRGEWEVRPGERLVLRADFGRIVTGFLGFDLRAPRGGVIDVRYEERIGDTGPLAPLAGLRYLTRGHADAVRAQEQSGMRAAVVVIDPGPAGGRVAVSDLHLVERVQRWEPGGSFDSDDRELVALWRAGVRTVQANTVDAFTDCPTREQRAWVGDGVVHETVHLTTNGDWSAARAYVSLAASPRADGLLPMSVAGDVEEEGGVSIPSWSLHWVHGWYLLYRYAGAVPEVTAALPVARRVLQWFEPYRSVDGVLRATGEWDLIDWSSIVVDGESAVLTALWVRALREFVEVCDDLCDAGSARWARGHVGAAERGFEAFWDAERELYVDSRRDGCRLAPASQASNAAAVAAGLVPVERVQGVLDRISDPARLVVRTWMSDPDGHVDPDKWARVSAGEWVIDWDADTRIVRAEPFFSAVVHEAYLRYGRVDLIDRAIRDWSGFLRDGQDTFGETWRWGTPCHGWSATPSADIVRAILGVTPAAPGYDEVRIAPRPRPGTRVRGTVPTPHGDVRVEVDEHGNVRLCSPVPVLLVLGDDRETRLPAGEHVAVLSASTASAWS